MADAKRINRSKSGVDWRPVRDCSGCGKAGRWYWWSWCDRCVPETELAKAGAMLLAARDGAAGLECPEDAVVAGRIVHRVQRAIGLTERNLEDLVIALLRWLGHERSSLELQAEGADIAVLRPRAPGAAKTRAAVMVVEVKRSIGQHAARRQALRQAFDYAARLGARHVVITDADRYEVFDRTRGLNYASMRIGSFRVTAFKLWERDGVRAMAA